MRSKTDFAGMISLFRPFFLYLIVLWAVSAAMEAVWSWPALCSESGRVGPAGAYALAVVRDCLHLILPPAAGCLAVRGTVLFELRGFSGRFPDRVREKGSLDPAGRLLKKIAPLSVRMLPVLLVSTLFLSAAMNIFFSLIVPGGKGGMSPDASLPGIWGFLIQLSVYGFCIPLIEELVFRGLLFPRLERAFGLAAGVLVSAAFFGAYHGSPVQALYAFVMGLVFACSYAVYGKFSLPFSLHGMCNLNILLLVRLDLYPLLCTPAWCLALFSVAAGGFFSIFRFESRKKDL